MSGDQESGMYPPEPGSCNTIPVDRDRKNIREERVDGRMDPLGGIVE